MTDIELAEYVKSITVEVSEWVVWGCGPWPGRKSVVPYGEPPYGEPPEWVHEDHPAFGLLPAEFVFQWGEAFGSQHWAEVVTCGKDDLLAAIRGESNVYGYKIVD